MISPNQKQAGNFLVISSAVMVCIIYFGALLLPENWTTWGFDSITYLDSGQILTLVILAFASSAFVYIALGNRTLLMQLSRIPVYVWVIAILIMSILNPAATYLRGDGQLLVNHLLINEPASYRAPLSGLMSRAVAFVFQFSSPAPVTIYRFIDSIALILFSFSAIVYSRKFKSSSVRMLVIFTFIFSAILPLLFGLIEHYAMMQALLMLAFVLTEKSLRSDKLPFMGFIVYLIASLFHVSALSLLPAWILVFPIIQGKAKWSIYWIGSALSIIVASILLKEHLLYPLGKLPKDGYTLFSIRHILDLLNLDLWSLPVLIFATVPFIIINDQRLLSKSGSFFLATTISAILYVLVFSPDLGMARDVDLYAIYALPATFWIVSLIPKESSGYSTRIAATLALFIGLITVGSTIVRQADEGATVDRFEKLLVEQPLRSAYGWEVLGIHYRNQGSTDDELRCFENALQFTPLLHDDYPRYHSRLAELAIDAGEFDESRNHAIAALESDSTYALAHSLLGYIFQKSGNDSLAELHYKKSLDFDKNNSAFIANYSTFLVGLNRADEAIINLEYALTNSPNNIQVLLVLGTAYEANGNKTAAIKNYSRVILLAPNSNWGKMATNLKTKLVISRPQ